MHVYKRVPTLRQQLRRRRTAALRTQLQRETTADFEMLCSRCVLPLLALYMLLEEISASVLPSRNKREVSWLDQELFPRLHERTGEWDLSVGDAAEVAGRDVDGRPSGPETVLSPTQHVSVQRQSQFQYHRKANEKRKKMAPMDTIGRFQISSFRNQKDEPEIHWEEYMK